MALTEKQQNEMFEAVIELKTAIVGMNGKGGLIDKVEELAKGYGRLKRNFFLLCGILVGSGAIAGGISQLLGS